MIKEMKKDPNLFAEAMQHVQGGAFVDKGQASKQNAAKALADNAFD